MQGVSKHDMEDYLVHYKTEFQRQIQNLLISPHFFLPMEARFGIGYESSRDHISNRSFTGK